VDAADLAATLVRAHEHLADVLAAGATPVLLGGDASISVPALQVLAGKLRGVLGSSPSLRVSISRYSRGASPPRAGRKLWSSVSLSRATSSSSASAAVPMRPRRPSESRS
jgi:hypothetical protein